MPSKTRNVFALIWTFVSIATAVVSIDMWLKILIILSTLPTIICELSGIANKTPIRKVLFGVWSSFLQPYMMIGLTACGLVFRAGTDAIPFVTALYLLALPLMVYTMKKWLCMSLWEASQEDEKPKRPFMKFSWQY